jgi:hypothetical protein
LRHPLFVLLSPFSWEISEMRCLCAALLLLLLLLLPTDSDGQSSSSDTGRSRRRRRRRAPGLWTKVNEAVPVGQSEGAAGCADLDLLSGQDMFVFGGYGAGEPTSELTRISLPSSGGGGLGLTTVSRVATALSPPLPSARKAAACAVIGDTLFIFGGVIASGTESGYWALNVSSAIAQPAAWQLRSSTNPNAVGPAASATDRVVLYFANGLHGWDTATDVIGRVPVSNSLAELPPDLRGASLVRIDAPSPLAAASNWTFLLFGGVDTTTALPGFENGMVFRVTYNQGANAVSYTLDHDGKSGTGVPGKRQFHAAGWDPVGRRMYVGYGWLGGPGVASTGHYRYDEVARQWSSMSVSGSVPAGFYRMASATLIDPQTGNRILVTAGGMGTSLYLTAVHALEFGSTTIVGTTTSAGSTGRAPVSPGTTGTIAVSTGSTGDAIVPVTASTAASSAAATNSGALGASSASSGGSGSDALTLVIAGAGGGGALLLLCVVVAVVVVLRRRDSHRREGSSDDISGVELSRAEAANNYSSPAAVSDPDQEGSVEYHNVSALDKTQDEPEGAYHNRGPGWDGS